MLYKNPLKKTAKAPKSVVAASLSSGKNKTKQKPKETATRLYYMWVRNWLSIIRRLLCLTQTDEGKEDLHKKEKQMRQKIVTSWS